MTTQENDTLPELHNASRWHNKRGTGIIDGLGEILTFRTDPNGDMLLDFHGELSDARAYMVDVLALIHRNNLDHSFARLKTENERLRNGMLSMCVDPVSVERIANNEDTEGDWITKTDAELLAASDELRRVKEAGNALLSKIDANTLDEVECHECGSCTSEERVRIDAIATELVALEQLVKP